MRCRTPVGNCRDGARSRKGDAAFPCNVATKPTTILTRDWNGCNLCQGHPRADSAVIAVAGTSDVATDHPACFQRGCGPDTIFPVGSMFPRTSDRRLLSCHPDSARHVDLANPGPRLLVKICMIRCNVLSPCRASRSSVGFPNLERSVAGDRERSNRSKVDPATVGGKGRKTQMELGVSAAKSGEER
jgi:hypothetical protein